MATRLITKEQFKEYCIDVKGYDESQVKEIFAEMREFGTPLQEYLTSYELEECIKFSA